MINIITNNPIKSGITLLAIYTFCFGSIKLRYSDDKNVTRSFKLIPYNVINKPSPFYSTYIINHINNTKTSISYRTNERFLHNLIRFQPIINKDIKITNI
jgi:hypothetical protein